MPGVLFALSAPLCATPRYWLFDNPRKHGQIRAVVCVAGTQKKNRGLRRVEGVNSVVSPPRPRPSAVPSSPRQTLGMIRAGVRDFRDTIFRLDGAHRRVPTDEYRNVEKRMRDERVTSALLRGFERVSVDLLADARNDGRLPREY